MGVFRAPKLCAVGVSAGETGPRTDYIVTTPNVQLWCPGAMGAESGAHGDVGAVFFHQGPPTGHLSSGCDIS